VKNRFRCAPGAIITIVAVWLSIASAHAASDQTAAPSAPTPSLASIPLAPKAAAGQPIFKDDFASFAPSWGSQGPTASVSDGYLVLTPVHGKSVMVPNLRYRYRDIDASVDVTPTPALHGAEWAGLVFWGRDEKDYYVAAITNTGKVSVIECANGQLTLKAEKQGATPDAFATQTVTITLAARGNRAEVSAWGATLSLTRASVPKDGGFIGLYAKSPEETGWIWRFSKLIVSAPAK
jgi:hypothetical protein